MASSTLTRLADIAQDQWGLVTRRQAEKAGTSTRTLARLSAEGKSVRELAAHFGKSEPTIRKALRLVQEGGIEFPGGDNPANQN